MEILKGLPVANSINEQLTEDIKNIDGELPHLAIIRVGERPDDCSYERGAVKKMDKVGVRCTTYTLRQIYLMMNFRRNSTGLTIIPT